MLSFRCFVLSLCHFVASFSRLVHQFLISLFPCVISLFRFVTRLVFSSLRCLVSSFRFAYLTALAWEREQVYLTELHEVRRSRRSTSTSSLWVMWRTRHLRSDELKTYLRQSVQFIFNRVSEQFDESES